MLTRLKVNGFKNLVETDVRFGPFTCIAGANGVGKSNLFDAICFLSALSEKSLVEAARSVRDEEGHTTDIRSLFHRVGEQYDSEMSFEAEMIVPSTGIDDLGQEAKASITFLKYHLVIAYKENGSKQSSNPLEIRREELVHITLGEAKQHLLFPHKPEWRKSAVQGRRAGSFISTDGEGEGRIIKLHQDGGGHGRPVSRSAMNLPRTVLSTVNAAESPTALLAKREMQSWRLLHLEPSALRRPDDFTAPNHIETDGAHLAATLNRLARNGSFYSTGEEEETQIFGQIAGRLSQLISDVYEVSIDRDERRELLTVQVTGRDKTTHPARALSDGTLRFLALAVLELDPEAQGILCLEEPENGIHPERIPAMLRLLQDIANDTYQPIGPDNPMRQVIINTHSPAVVAQIPDDSLLVAEPKEVLRSGQRFNRVVFSSMENTWRARSDNKANVVARGTVLSYLNPIEKLQKKTDSQQDSLVSLKGRHEQKARRVIDREEIYMTLPFSELDAP